MNKTLMNLFQRQINNHNKFHRSVVVIYAGHDCCLKILIKKQEQLTGFLFKSRMKPV